MTDEYVKSILLKKDAEGNYILYDIKDEFRSILAFGSEQGTIDKWRKYRQYQPLNISSEIDCDVSELAVYVYLYAYGFLYSCLQNQYINAGRPTKQYKTTRGGGYEVYQYKYQLVLNHPNAGKEYYRGDTMTSFARTYSHFEKNFHDDTQIRSQIELLAKLHHTIGNMIPVPSFFNLPRSGRWAIYDFWDLAMNQIKGWYENKTDTSLEQLLNPCGNDEYIYDSIACCKQWLNYFKDWDDFVQANYLQDFVDQEKRPIPFWANHSYENADLPQDQKLFLAYIQKLNRLIENRNDRILDRLDRILTGTG